MTKDRSLLTDAQWEKIAPLLPEPERSSRGGRPPIPNRECFEGILWVLRSGARWKDLPREYPSASTCRRRLNEWEESGVWERAWVALIRELDERRQINWLNVFTDGTFVPAKKGASVWDRPNAERVRSSWWWRTARVFLSECTWQARPPRRSRSSKRPST